jgi:hypothetical protein
MSQSTCLSWGWPSDLPFYDVDGREPELPSVWNPTSGLIVNANEMLRNAITHNRYRRPAGARLVWSRGYRGHLIEIYDDSTVSVRGEDLIFAGVDEAIRFVDVRARQMGG